MATKKRTTKCAYVVYGASFRKPLSTHGTLAAALKTAKAKAKRSHRAGTATTVAKRCGTQERLVRECSSEGYCGSVILDAARKQHAVDMHWRQIGRDVRRAGKR